MSVVAETEDYDPPLTISTSQFKFVLNINKVNPLCVITTTLEDAQFMACSFLLEHNSTELEIDEIREFLRTGSFSIVSNLFTKRNNTVSIFRINDLTSSSIDVNISKQSLEKQIEMLKS